MPSSSPSRAYNCETVEIQSKGSGETNLVAVGNLVVVSEDCDDDL